MTKDQFFAAFEIAPTTAVTNGIEIDRPVTKIVNGIEVHDMPEAHDGIEVHTGIKTDPSGLFEI